MDSLTALLTSLLQKLNRDEAATQFFIATLERRGKPGKDGRRLARRLRLSGGHHRCANNIPIRYEPALRFSGVMTAAQRTILLTDASLAAVTGIQPTSTPFKNCFNSRGGR